MATYEIVTYIALVFSFVILFYMSVRLYKTEYKNTNSGDWVIDFAAGKPYKKSVK